MAIDPGKRLKKVEAIFDAAQEVVKSVTFNEETKTTDITLHPDGYEIDDVGEIEDGKVFDLMELKKDFISIKRNLQKLIRQGQNMMESVGFMDLEEMPAARIEAISKLSNVISLQLKMIVEVYKDITEIEKTRAPVSALPGIIPGAVHGDFNQQIIFAGDSASLLKHLKEQQ